MTDYDDYEPPVTNTIIEPRLGWVFIPHLKYHGVPVEGIMVNRLDGCIEFRIEGRWVREDAAAERDEVVT